MFPSSFHGRRSKKPTILHSDFGLFWLFFLHCLFSLEQGLGSRLIACCAYRSDSVTHSCSAKNTEKKLHVQMTLHKQLHDIIDIMVVFHFINMASHQLQMLKLPGQYQCSHFHCMQCDFATLDIRTPTELQ